jgi:probable glucuronoxylan glucuronosyltransferase IRX7
VAVHQALLSYAGPPEGADHFLLPVYVSCNFSTPNGFPSLSHARGLLADAVQLIRAELPYWNRSDGADHVFVASHDFGACFHPMVSCSPQPQSFELSGFPSSPVVACDSPLPKFLACE